ncbi:primase-helicase family protein [Alteriqipengyuania lutimaris]|uniref:primase-helicase family protein n=1 Tax=Alteriqipengyuania lutimaris TaxID=1538146 RepID=UPI001CFD48C2|nr:primase-helicase family protein [Alteriqipengyuania lutimaris]
MKTENDTAPSDEAALGAENASHSEKGTPSSEPRSDQREDRAFAASLDDIGSVAGYLRRVGASATNFRRAEKREQIEGYDRPVGWLEFAADGTVTPHGEIEAPTEFEQKAICEAFKGVDFPRLVTLAAIPEPPSGVSLSDRMVYACHAPDGEFVMLHQRYETKDGGKGFIPWTRWSDGKWRKMEPDTLPFFGLPGGQSKTTLVIHEGAKAADRIKSVQSGELRPDKLPWWPELEHAHHVGWIGGVYQIERSDWDALASGRWSRIVVVADNDAKGLSAAKRIARKFGSNVWILAFDSRFELGFDLADPFPDEMFDDREVYTGPAMRDCLIPATRATRLIPAEGRGRPTAVLSDDFAPMVASTVEPPRIILRHNPSRDLRPEQFNQLIAPMSDVKDTATKVYARLECQHDRLLYRPGDPPGTLAVDGGRGFNVYESGVRPVAGDPSPWLDYLAHLFPDEKDRAKVMRWLATLIAKPKVRLTYGMLLISSTHGVGKSTLGLILRAVLGPSNVSFPSESSIVDSAFNSWLARKRCIFVNEFYSGHSRRAYDRLKPLVTDTLVPINEKGVPEYEMENWATFIACSNSEAALHLDDEDRRWLVPTVAESTPSREWWARLHDWIAAEGPGIVAHWAASFVEAEGFVRAGEHAPGTSRKQMIVEGSRSEGQQLAVQLGDHLTSLDRPVILRTRDIRKWIAEQRGFRDLSDKRLEKPDTILRAIKHVPGITVWANAQRPKFGATRDSVVMNFVPDPGAKWADIKDRLINIEGANVDEPF